MNRRAAVPLALHFAAMILAIVIAPACSVQPSRPDTAQPARRDTPNGTIFRQFAVGQVWTYHARPDDSGSTLQINKIDMDPQLGAIYHISIFGIHVPSSDIPGVIITELPHVPVSKQTLEESVETLMSQPARDVDFMEGYALWRHAFDTGHGGVYTTSVAEIVNALALQMGLSSQ